MYDPKTHLRVTADRHADLIRGARQHPLAGIHPRERRQTLGRLGRALVGRRSERTLDAPDFRSVRGNAGA
jgi:hypothetical protein